MRTTPLYLRREAEASIPTPLQIAVETLRKRRKIGDYYRDYWPLYRKQLLNPDMIINKNYPEFDGPVLAVLTYLAKHRPSFFDIGYWHIGHDWLFALSRIVQPHHVQKVMHWRPSGRSESAPYRSLIRYLLGHQVAYPFVMGSILRDDYREEYQSLAAGTPFTKLAFKRCHINKPVLRYLRKVPTHYDLYCGLSYAKALSLRASAQLAEEIVEALDWYGVYKYLDNRFDGNAKDDPRAYMESVLQFVVKNWCKKPDADLGKVFCYLLDQRYIYDDTQDECVVRCANPRYAVRDKTVAGILKAVKEEEQRNEISDSKYDEEKPDKWCRNPIAQDFICKVDGIIYLICQLTSQQELLDEGNAMHHCVHNYTKEAAEADCTIWSVIALPPNGIEQKCATIELNDERKVKQIKAKCNAAPSNATMRIVHKWARKEKLAVGSYF